MAKGTIKKAGTELAVEEYAISKAFNLDHGKVIEKQLAISKPGYMPIGIVGYNFSGAQGMSYLHFYKLYLFDIQPGSCSIETYIRNTHATLNATSVVPVVYVLWQKI